MAFRASLQMSSDRQIQTPKQLYEWASENINGITFNFAAHEDMSVNANELIRRFRHAVPVRGIRNFHTYLPQTNDTVSFKLYSLAKNETNINVLEYYNRNFCPAPIEGFTTR